MDASTCLKHGGIWPCSPSRFRSSPDRASVKKRVLSVSIMNSWVYNKQNWTRWFVLSAGGILLVTGLAKVVSASGKAGILDSSDPIFAITFRNLLLFVGLMELTIAAICLLTGKDRLCIFLVGWLAANFAFYRVGLLFIGWHRPCNCLGSLTGVLHISPGVADAIAQTLMVYLLCGSCVGIFRSLRSSSILDTGVAL